MISLKRNKKTGEFVEATGVTSQKWRIYQPNQNKDFVLSRSRFLHTKFAYTFNLLVTSIIFII